MAVCDSVVSIGKTNTCKALVPASTKEYEYPIDCLRHTKYCRIAELDNRDFYLKQTGCDTKANPLCEAQYIVEIK
jgi:hypothetical protein